MNINHIILCAIMLTTAACSTRSERSGDAVIIQKPGNYKIRRLSYDILIKKNANEITYKIVTADNHTIIACPYSFNDFQRWSLYWDKMDQLWVWSSDIGGMIWKKGLGGKYVSFNLNDEQHWYEEMPYDFYITLPDLVKDPHPRKAPEK